MQRSLHALVQKRYRTNVHALTNLQIIILAAFATEYELNKLRLNLPDADQIDEVCNPNGLNAALIDADAIRIKKRGWVTAIVDKDMHKMRGIVENPDTQKKYSEFNLNSTEAREGLMDDANRSFYWMSKIGYMFMAYDCYMYNGARPDLVEHPKGITGGHRILPNWAPGWYYTGVPISRQIDMAISEQMLARGYKCARHFHRVWQNDTPPGKYGPEDYTNSQMGCAANSVLRIRTSREEAASIHNPYIEDREI